MSADITHDTDELLDLVIQAKCLRWALGNCIKAPPDETPTCAICAYLSTHGYEPYLVSKGGLSSWRPVA